MLGNADGTNTRATATVRHCEGLVEIEVADICSDITRIGQTNLCIHICTIHINLTACIVYGIYNLSDATFEYTVR